MILDWAERHTDTIPPLRFEPGARWFSEPLLGSRFKPRRRGDPTGEGFTHADGVIGHFELRTGRGDIELRPDARQLTVIEAKMASGLSAGTKNAPTFNQAARNVACMAHLVERAKVDPTSIRLSFVVLAPKGRIDEGVFGMVTNDAVCAAVTARAAAYDEEAARWCADSFTPLMKGCPIEVVSWESVLDAIEAADPESGAELWSFYRECLVYNPLRSSV